MSSCCYYRLLNQSGQQDMSRVTYVILSVNYGPNYRMDGHCNKCADVQILIEFIMIILIDSNKQTEWKKLNKSLLVHLMNKKQASVRFHFFFLFVDESIIIWPSQTGNNYQQIIFLFFNQSFSYQSCCYFF